MHNLTPTKLAGKWMRISQNPTDVEIYPKSIEFCADGCYLTQMEDNVFYEWQAGDFEVVDDVTIKIQISNDAMVTYHYNIHDDELTFIANDGSSVCYQKSSGTPD